MNKAQLIVLSIVPAVFAITVHEVMHGYAALRLGDDTAERAGRLTLNPLKHVDLLGTIIVPLLLIISQSSFVFGWAKPVPVNLMRLYRPKRDMVWVAAAGPAANLGMMLLWGLLSLAISWVLGGIRFAEGGAVELVLLPLWQMCTLGVMYNVVLGVFNLIPIPPLDGGRIMTGLLPLEYARVFASLERFGFLIVIALFFIFPGFISFLVLPIIEIAAALFRLPAI